MTVLFANNANTTLAAGISPSTTTILVATGTGALFPSPSGGDYFSLTLNDVSTGAVYEVCYCTARTGDSLTVTRGQEGTTAVSWLLGDHAYNAATAGDLRVVGGVPQNVAVYQIIAGTQQVSINGASFTSTGATTFTVPPSGNFDVELWGAGGGSGGTLNPASGSGAGAGGGYSRKLFTGQTAGTVLPVSIGTGGSAGSSSGPTSGGTGGTTSFGSGGTLFSATGGNGGSAANGAVASLPVSGGGGVNGDININGGGSTQPYNLTVNVTTSVIQAANGGAPYGMPPTTNGWAAGSFNGVAGGNPGCGAAGAVNGGTGAAGAAGQCIIRW